MAIKWIKIKDITDGMILGKDLEDEMGRVLLRPGEVLSTRFINRLETWGILEVPIEIPDDDDDAQGSSDESSPRASDSQIIRLIDILLDKRFRPHEGDEAMALIHEVARRKLVLSRTRADGQSEGDA